MSLNIKNPHVHALARDAARVTGMSQTAAIQAALELLLRSYGEDPAGGRVRERIDIVHGILVEYTADAGTAQPAIRQVEDLYDAGTGLPR